MTKEIKIINIDDEPVLGTKDSFLDILEKNLAAEKQHENQVNPDNEQPQQKKNNTNNWKVRKKALEEIAEKVTNLTSFDSELFILLPNILNENHLGNLEEAVNILQSFLEKEFEIPKESQNVLNEIIKLLIEKCYSSSKQSLIDKSKDMIISFVEYLKNTDNLVMFSKFIEGRHCPTIFDSFIL